MRPAIAVYAQQQVHVQSPKLWCARCTYLLAFGDVVLRLYVEFGAEVLEAVELVVDVKAFELAFGFLVVAVGSLALFFFWVPLLRPSQVVKLIACAASRVVGEGVEASEVAGLSGAHHDR